MADRKADFRIENAMRYPKKQPWQCTVSWWQGKGYYCHNTRQKLGDDGSPSNPKCVACRDHYAQKSKVKQQKDLLGNILPKSWKHISKLEEPGVEDVDIDLDDMPDIEVDLDEPIWEHFKRNPPRTVDGNILYGNCGVPGYSRKACWRPILDDLCTSCIYHYSNDTDYREPWEDPEESWE